MERERKGKGKERERKTYSRTIVSNSLFIGGGGLVAGVVAVGVWWRWVC